MSFQSLGLCAEILRAVSDTGYTEPTPVQAEAIPYILSGRDIMAGAQTGTGKTAGFTLPILERLAKSKAGHQNRPVRALILVPTRELAAQVHESVMAYGKHTDLSSTVIFGGVNIRPQITKLRRGVDILIATPGRLLDHINQGNVDLSKVETLVLDEADRMLDMGFIPDVKRLIKLIPDNRQTLLFSATFSKEIKQLAAQFLNDPAQVQIAVQNATADRIDQAIHLVDQKQKRELLSHMIGTGNWHQVLIFTRTKHGANRLATQLDKDGIKSAAIHGNKSQGARTKALQDFKDGKIRALVATDIAARGLDIDHLPHVVNYELPHKPEDYVHRIGRTGRAGNEGLAISLVCREETKLLRDIEKLLKRELPQTKNEGYEPTEPALSMSAAAPVNGGNRGNSGRNSNRNNGQSNRRNDSKRSNHQTSANDSGNSNRRSSNSSSGNSSGHSSNSSSGNSASGNSASGHSSSGNSYGGGNSAASGNTSSSGNTNPYRGRSTSRPAANGNSANGNRSASGNRSSAGGGRRTANAR